MASKITKEGCAMDSNDRPEHGGGLPEFGSRSSVTETKQQPEVTLPPSTNTSGESKKKNKAFRFLKKYWWAILPVVLIIAGLIAWRTYEMNIDATWSKATDYHSKAKYNEAAKLIEGMSMPTDEKRLTVYAQTMLATRQLDKALPAYNSLYDIKKEPAYKIIIGNIYNEQKKYDEAAKVYRELITANSTFVQAYVNLSTLYKLQAKSTEAVEVAKEGIKANPNSVVLHELLISMLLDKQDSLDFKQAVDALKKLNPQDPIFDTIKK